MKKHLSIALCAAVLFTTGTVVAKEWATSEGSCYGKRSKNISFGMSVLHFGFFGAFDYGIHDAISVGGASGYNGYSHNSFWRYNYVPIVVRGAFHPFNLSVLSDKIKVRNKLDVYVGLSSGGRIGWATWKASGTELPEPDVGGFFIREYIGIRFYPTEIFYLTVEEGSGLGLFNMGVGFRF